MDSGHTERQQIQGRIMDTLDDWTVDTQRGTVDIYRGAVITQRDSGHTEGQLADTKKDNGHTEGQRADTRKNNGRIG